MALEPYKHQIAAWLSSEVTSRWTAERIFDELQERGHNGGRTVVKDYVRENRPRTESMGEARFMPSQGSKLQVHWGEMVVVSIRGVGRKLYAFVDHGVVAPAIGFASRSTCGC